MVLQTRSCRANLPCVSCGSQKAGEYCLLVRPAARSEIKTWGPLHFIWKADITDFSHLRSVSPNSGLHIPALLPLTPFGVSSAGPIFGLALIDSAFFATYGQVLALQGECVPFAVRFMHGPRPYEQHVRRTKDNPQRLTAPFLAAVTGGSVCAVLEVSLLLSP